MFLTIQRREDLLRDAKCRCKSLFLYPVYYSQLYRAIDVLEPLLYEITKTIEEVTGWKSHFVVGGPEPLRNGKITSFS